MLRNRLVWLSLLVVLVAVGWTFVTRSGFGQRASYGKPVTGASAEVVDMASLFARTGSYTGKDVVIEGRVGQVCLASGCWLTLSDGTNQLFVQFYDFTVRLAPGTRVKVLGELRVSNQAPYLVGKGLEVLK